MKRLTFHPLSIALCLLLQFACSTNKNIAQTTVMKNSSDSLAGSTNSNLEDTVVIIPFVKKLQKNSDFIIAFGELNYAWGRKGTYTVMVKKNDEWSLYSFEAPLPAPADFEMLIPVPRTLSAEVANSIMQRYNASGLWKTKGDNDNAPCPRKQDCNINDATTWLITATTPQAIHSTTYYAPEFFEECCPGNKQRQQFVAIAKEMRKLTGGANGFPVK